MGSLDVADTMEKTVLDVEVRLKVEEQLKSQAVVDIQVGMGHLLTSQWLTP